MVYCYFWSLKNDGKIEFFKRTNESRFHVYRVDIIDRRLANIWPSERGEIKRENFSNCHILNGFRMKINNGNYQGQFNKT